MSSSSERTEDTEPIRKHSGADKSTEQKIYETVPQLRNLSVNGSADLETLNRILRETESKINRLELKLSAAVDEKLKSLEEKLSAVDEKLLAGNEKIKVLEERRTEILPNYFVIILTLGIAVFTGVLMWYLSKGPTDKTMKGTEELIKNGFKTFNDYLSIYLSILKDRTRKGTTTLVGSFIKTTEIDRRGSTMNE